jgi:hypothetical protein
MEAGRTILAGQERDAEYILLLILFESTPSEKNGWTEAHSMTHSTTSNHSNTELPTNRAEALIQTAGNYRAAISLFLTDAGVSQ